jgi:hypothetical protein
MCSLFNDPAFMDNKNKICIHDGGKTMCNGYDGTFACQLAYGCLYLTFGLYIDGCCGFIQYDNWAVTEYCTSYGYTLLLSSG